jgi:3'-phosphoadenosine 5'-phosphosulfate sulfotransferase (PAPS reductase)/FAD synthetase
VAFSAGKDSSTLANLTLSAAADVAGSGERPLIIIVHADVGVENPSITQLARSEINKIKRFAALKGFDLLVRISEPAQGNSFAVRVIGGRALPTFPDTRRDCTSDWKIEPNERCLAQLAKDLAARRRLPLVLMTGVRRDESVARAQSVDSRCETSAQPWTDDKGRLRMSPLLEWTSDDIWTYLGLCAAGTIEAFSDFAETMQVYRDAGGSSCVVVADAISQKHSKPCASRFGCWVCTAVREDHSLHQMIESDPVQHGWMKPLADFRDYLAYSQYDWSRRNFVGRTIENGYIEIGADTYSPDMLADLLRMALSVQAETGVPVVSEAQLIAIDARWSAYAIAPPFTALAIWKQVEDGHRWLPPKITPVPKTPVPKLGKILVGGDWNDDVPSQNSPTGLRHTGMELFSETCGAGLRTLNNGRRVLNIEDQFSEVDDEAAYLFLEFEAQRMLRQYARWDGYWTIGYLTYASFGMLGPGKGGSRRVDEILRRSAWRQRHGLHGQQDPKRLRQKLSVRYLQQADLFEDMEPA